jgi:hypothetical protein
MIIGFSPEETISVYYFKETVGRGIVYEMEPRALYRIK